MRHTVSRCGAAAGLLLVAVALAGCGSSGANVADDPGTTAAAPSTSTSTPSTAAPTSSAPSGAASDAAGAGRLITLDEPAEGAQVSGGSFHASGTANSPEANVPWRILDSHGTKVLDGAFTADGWMDKLYPYQGKVDVSSLAPGTYTFVVSVDNEADGESSLPPQQVSRTITVS